MPYVQSFSWQFWFINPYWVFQRTLVDFLLFSNNISTYHLESHHCKLESKFGNWRLKSQWSTSFAWPYFVVCKTSFDTIIPLSHWNFPLISGSIKEAVGPLIIFWEILEWGLITYKSRRNFVFNTFSEGDTFNYCFGNLKGEKVTTIHHLN